MSNSKGDDNDNVLAERIYFPQGSCIGFPCGGCKGQDTTARTSLLVLLRPPTPLPTHPPTVRPASAPPPPHLILQGDSNDTGVAGLNELTSPCCESDRYVYILCAQGPFVSFLVLALKRTTESSKRRCWPCSESSPNWPHLASLRWLPIDSRIQYKLTSLCHSCLNSTAAFYFIELLTVY